MKSPHIILFIFCCNMFFSCAKPYNDFDYKSLKGWEHNDTVKLFLYTDTSKIYDMNLCMRISDAGMDSTFTTVPITILFISPAGNQFYDTLTLPLFIEEARYKKTNGYTDISWEYLKGIKSKEEGEWKLLVNRTDNRSKNKFIMGFGANIKTK